MMCGGGKDISDHETPRPYLDFRSIVIPLAVMMDLYVFHFTP
jgi:hypothetical protein